MMTPRAKELPTFEIDSNEAIGYALLEDDFRFVSGGVRHKLEQWLRRQIEDGLASGPSIEMDVDAFFENVKQRGRERLRAAGKL